MGNLDINGSSHSEITHASIKAHLPEGLCSTLAVELNWLLQDNKLCQHGEAKREQGYLLRSDTSGPNLLTPLEQRQTAKRRLYSRHMLTKNSSRIHGLELHALISQQSVV